MPATPMINFTWHRDQAGYKLLPETLRTPAKIIGKGGPQKPYRPLEEFPALLKVFAEIEKTPEGVLGFIEKFGRLTNDPEGESVPTVIGWARLMEKRLPRVAGRQEDIPPTILKHISSLIVTKFTSSLDLQR